MRRQLDATPMPVLDDAGGGLAAVFVPHSQTAGRRTVLNQVQGIVVQRLAAGEEVPNAATILAPAATLCTSTGRFDRPS